MEARTREEAVCGWIDMGYPTQEELDRRRNDRNGVGEQAARGDLAAMGTLGEKQLRQEKIVEGQSNLNEAAMLGLNLGNLDAVDWQRGGNTITFLSYISWRPFVAIGFAALAYADRAQKGNQDRRVVLHARQWAMLPATCKELRRVLRGLPPLGIDT
ncbi:MAG: hypothetical protein IPH50_14830 [Rhodanobacteraceae bacterium]|nr:hypothetical protein [Rhodanobacteraceae bacterium]